MSDDVPAPPDESTERQKTLRRLLRRRGRAGKARANSGASIKGKAEYGNYSFTPSGDASSSRGCMLSVLLFIGLGFPIFIVLFGHFSARAQGSSAYFETGGLGGTVLWITVAIIGLTVFTAISMAMVSLYRIIVSQRIKSG